MPFTSKHFFITTPPNEPDMGVANAPIGKNPPLCLRPQLYTKHLALPIVFSF